MNCSKCGNAMDNLGNIENKIYCSNPPQWDEVWVCHKCKLKRTIRIVGSGTLHNSKIDLSEYLEILEK